MISVDYVTVFLKTTVLSLTEIDSSIDYCRVERITEMADEETKVLL